MPDEDLILTVCPNCGEVYQLPREYVGQEATCEKCNTNFTIVEAVAEGESENSVDNSSETTNEAVATDITPHENDVPDEVLPDASKKNTNIDEANTQKIPRMKAFKGAHNMVPNIDDQFRVSVQKTKMMQRSGSLKNAVKRAKEEKTQPPKPEKKWWQFWK